MKQHACTKSKNVHTVDHLEALGTIYFLILKVSIEHQHSGVKLISFVNGIELMRILPRSRQLSDAINAVTISM